MNSGKPVETFEVSKILKNEEFGESCRKSSQGFFNFMWSQSTPIFKGSHLRNILTACFIQFAVCNTLNGFFTFFPEITNKISLWNQASTGSATVCEVFISNFTVGEPTSTNACTVKLEMSTFGYIYENVVLALFSFILITFTINRVGKLIILCIIFITTGVSAILLIFVTLPTVSLHLYIVMLLAGLAINVINALTFELFPTKMRAMAICISMMFGRLGSVTGSILIGALIDRHCKETFIMPTVLLFSSLALSFTIPNISKTIK